MSGSRGLTEGEIEMARSLYGDSIDYSQIKIHDDNYFPWPNEDRVAAPDGDIHYPNDQHQDDFSKASPEDKEEFMHEMGHVLQYQNGMWLKTRAFFEGPGDYDWSDKFENGVEFRNWTVEEQAEFLADVYRARLNETLDKPTSQRGVSKEDMEAFFETLDLNEGKTFSESVPENGLFQEDIRNVNYEGGETGVGNGVALASGSGELPLIDAIKILASDQAHLETMTQDGASSLAYQAVTHPNCEALFTSLVENDVLSLNVELSPDMNPEERIRELLLAGEGAAESAGISLPENTSTAAAQMATHAAQMSQVHAEDNYDYDV